MLLDLRKVADLPVERARFGNQVSRSLLQPFDIGENPLGLRGGHVRKFGIHELLQPLDLVVRTHKRIGDRCGLALQIAQPAHGALQRGEPTVQLVHVLL